MNTHRRLRCVSYGAGVQSTSLLVLAAQRRIDARLGRDPVWLTRFNRPLDEAVAAAQDELPGLDERVVDGDGCDNGACFT
jgi:hypothetical protein